MMAGSIYCVLSIHTTLFDTDLISGSQSSNKYEKAVFPR